MAEYTTSAEELCDAYRGVRARVRAAVESVAPEHMERFCPATPAWRAHDVLAHLVGVPSDVLAGNLDGVASNPWTQAQVDARRDVTPAEMLDAWDVDGVAVEPIMTAVGVPTFGQMVFDAVTHELDLLHGIARPADGDSSGVARSFEWLVGVAGPSRPEPLLLRTEIGEVVVGVGEPAVSVELSRFEYIRAASGRRSASQVAAYPSHGTLDPTAILGAPLFSLATTDIIE